MPAAPPTTTWPRVQEPGPGGTHASGGGADGPGGTRLPGPRPPEPIRRPPAEQHHRGRRWHRPGWPVWLTGGDRAVLQLYLVTRIGLWITAYCTAWLFPRDPQATHAPSVLSRWAQWDWQHFQHIAEHGYFSGTAGALAPPDNREAFFPGFPLLLRAVHLVIPDWTVAGLLISLVAGAVAVVALARIAHLARGGAGSGERAVLFLLLSPCAVFLAAGYTESLFLALALPAWLAAKKGSWRLAAVLAACATATRISGLFLAAALAVEFLLARDGRRTWRSLPWLALPALPALLYTWYLQARTGDWMAWKHAQERGWHREFHPPWEAWSNTWNSAFDSIHPTGYGLMFQAELAGMVVGVLLLGWLLYRRRWPEAVYIALSLWALGTSYWYMSVPRATLLWWPLWIALATFSLRARWLKTAYLCAVGPLTTVFAVAFASGRWAG